MILATYRKKIVEWLLSILDDEYIWLAFPKSESHLVTRQYWRARAKEWREQFNREEDW